MDGAGLGLNFDYVAFLNAVLTGSVKNRSCSSVEGGGWVGLG